MLWKQDCIATIKNEPSILFFDLEMTGGNTRYDEILQFSIVDLYKGIIFNEYIKPKKCKSWKDTESIHHITPEMVKDCFTINAHKARISQLFKQADMLIGYGIENDLRFLYKEKLFVGKNTIIYDLQKSFSRIYSHDNNMPSLKSCSDYCHCPRLGKVHNSLIDTYITIYCFIVIYRLEMPVWLREVIDGQVDSAIDKIAEVS